MMRIWPSAEAGMRRSSFQSTLGMLAALTIGVLATRLLIRPADDIQFNNFVALHVFLEVCSILISLLVFVVARELHGEQQNRQIVIIGSAFLGVAVLDFMHAFNAQGMPAMITPSGPSKAINFWLAARLLGVSALLYVAWFSVNKFVPAKRIWSWTLAVLVLCVIVSWVILFRLYWLPVMFVPGRGLTATKVAIEYVIIAMCIVAAIGFYRQSRALAEAKLPWQPYDPKPLMAAMGITALSEVFFTLYTDVNGVYNFLGHVYKVVASWFVYRGLVAYNLRNGDPRLVMAQQIGGVATIDWDLAAGQGALGGDHDRLLGLPSRAAGEIDLVTKFMHPDDRAAWERACQLALRDGGRLVSEFRLTTEGGEPRWLRLQAYVAHDDEGKAIRMAGACYDITERKLAEQRLAASEERFKALVALSSDWYWEQDATLRFVEVAEGVPGLAGAKISDYIGRTRWEVPGVEADEAAWSAHRALLEEHRPFRGFEYRQSDETGNIMWMSVSGDPIVDAGGQFRGYRGTGRSITERKRAQEMLARSNERLEAEVQEKKRELESMYDAALNVMLTIDTNGIIQSVNAASNRVLGFSRDELVGENVKKIMPNPHSAAHDGYIRAYLDTNNKKIIGIGREVMALRKDGSTVPIHLSVSEFSVGGKRYFTGIVTDLTDRRAAELALRETERQLAQAQKMEAVGQLTGGLAHDFNNLLTVISGNLELLDMRLENEDERDLVRRASEATRMGARLTGRLLTFSRRRALQPTVLNLNDTTVGMTELLRHSLGEAVSVTSDLAPELWLTRVDASEIENAILNLAINARDAMPKGGSILIETRNVEITADSAHRQGDLQPGQYVLLSVSDTGSGMPPDVLARAFEPFFTTKDTGRGTGLGLSTIYGFVKQSGGNAVIESKVGRGTTVSLYLPRDTSEQPLPSKLEAQGGKAAHHGDTVLLVEDNADVRKLTVQRIEALGYRAVVAENGPAAIAVLEAGTKVDLVFSDVVMPGGMSGFDVLRWVRSHRPALPVLLTSGYAPDSGGDQNALAASATLLRKPYKLAELAQALGDALRSR